MRGHYILSAENGPRVWEGEWLIFLAKKKKRKELLKGSQRGWDYEAIEQVKYKRSAKAKSACTAPIPKQLGHCVKQK